MSDTTSTEVSTTSFDHRMRTDSRTDRAREILVVVANPTVSSNNNWPVGFWGAELTHPYYELTEAGFRVTIASPQGGRVEMDALSAYCHGVAALVDCDLEDGSALVAGRTVTGYSNVEEDYIDRAAGVQITPWRVEDALRERGANYVGAGLFKAFAVRDGRLITGQQQYSSRKVAQAVIAAIGV
ncbi:type 1 glutamine amidotransferase domain-containing protein [Streptomyces mirabilis]|uniref:type 1 glutamine amidotransferase domain-containing protein n=1 Tax=Streptomyces mirabilis TaxID=68239 RepID=UPI00369683E3